MAVIIDLSVLKYGVIHSRELSLEIKAKPELIKHYVLNSILYIKSQLQCSRKNELVLAIDRKKAFKNGEKTIYGYWRDVIYEEKKSILGDGSKGYKFGRERDASFDWEKIEECYSEVIEFLKNYTDFKVVEVPGIEADDICAVLSQSLPGKNTIVSSDKDLKKLVSDNILFFDWGSKKYETKTYSEEEKILFYLYGDSGDGIKSVKKGYRWENNLSKKTLDEIFREFPDLPLKERYLFNRKLMDLTLSALPKSVVSAIMDKYSKEDFRFHQIKIISELNKLGLNEMVEGDIKSIVNRSNEFQLPQFIFNKDNNKTKEYKKNIERENDIRSKFL